MKKKGEKENETPETLLEILVVSDKVSLWQKRISLSISDSGPSRKIASKRLHC